MTACTPCLLGTLFGTGIVAECEDTKWQNCSHLL
jgi:hypothetical protein